MRLKTPVTPRRLVNTFANAAFAAFWAGRLNQPQLALPFKAAGYLPAGQELLTLWESTPDAAENDRTMVDGWAEKLGIAGWH